MFRSHHPLVRFRSLAAALGLLAGAVLAPAPTPVSAQTRILSKSCSACGKPVSLSAQAGQSCPHCGAYWSDERTTYTNTEAPDPAPAFRPGRQGRRKRARAQRAWAPPAASAPRRQAKWCVECEGRVASSARVGQTCPHCGVRWVFADPNYAPGKTPRAVYIDPALGLTARRGFLPSRSTSSFTGASDPRFHAQSIEAANRNTMQRHDQMNQMQMQRIHEVGRPTR